MPFWLMKGFTGTLCFQIAGKSVFKILIITELIFFFINLVYFWLHWVFVAARGLSLIAASGGYSSFRCTGFSLQWLLLLRSMGSRHVGFSNCGTRA